MSSRQIKTRKGASAIYVVIFTATLLSVIALSFIRLMLSESTRTTNYSLSQSAYNSALAGIEDAKIVLIKYQNCLVSGNCPPEYTAAFSGDMNSLTNSQDCDLVPKLLGYSVTDTDGGNSPETSISTGGEDSSKAYNQAYTCVKVSRKSKDFIATLTKNNPTKIIPLRTGDNDKATSVNRLLISWFSRADLSAVNNTSGVIDSSYFSFDTSGSKMMGTIRTNNGFLPALDYANWFNQKPSVPTTLQTTLIQTAPSFKTSEFYSSDTASGRTNRGTILFRPSKNTSLKASNLITDNNNYSNHIDGNPFVTSATKSQNNPMDVYCNYENNIEWGNGYACVADVRIPMPKTTSVDQRNDETFFLVLNLPYGEPKTEVSVEMKRCDDHTKSIFEPGNCSNVYFDGSQAVVDSTGRANDLFRRVEARIELTDSNFPLANFALAAYDPTDGNISKSFYVTTANCKSRETIRDNSATEAGSTKINDASCNSAADY